MACMSNMMPLEEYLHLILAEAVVDQQVLLALLELAEVGERLELAGLLEAPDQAGPADHLVHLEHLGRQEQQVRLVPLEVQVPPVHLARREQEVVQVLLVLMEQVEMVLTHRVQVVPVVVAV